MLTSGLPAGAYKILDANELVISKLYRWRENDGIILVRITQIDTREGMIYVDVVDTTINNQYTQLVGKYNIRWSLTTYLQYYYCREDNGEHIDIYEQLHRALLNKS